MRWWYMRHKRGAIIGDRLRSPPAAALLSLLLYLSCHWHFKYYRLIVLQMSLHLDLFDVSSQGDSSNVCGSWGRNTLHAGSFPLSIMSGDTRCLCVPLLAASARVSVDEKKLISSQSKKEMENFIWANLRIIIWERVFLKTLRTVCNSLALSGEASIYVSLARGYRATKYTLW